MKSKMMLALFAVLLFGLTGKILAQEGAEKKIDNVGLKLNLGLGSQDFTSAQNLEQDGAASLSLGYGVSQRVGLWLGFSGGSYRHEDDEQLESGLASLEFSVQYKLRPGQKLQPYGKLGLGGFFLNTEETQVALTGGGVVWGIGAEYRVVRFLSIGAEFYWKDFDYEQQRLGKDGEFNKLTRPVQGNTRGFMLNFTLQ